MSLVHISVHHNMPDRHKDIKNIKFIATLLIKQLPQKIVNKYAETFFCL